MKKLIASVSLLSLFIFGAQALQPKEANAVLLIELAAGDHYAINLPEIVLCVIFLPLCLLDEKSVPPTSYASQDLLDNGYSPLQVSTLENDQNSVMSQLKLRNLSLVIESSDTRESIAKALRNIDPVVSDEYVDFVTDINHIGQ